MTESDEDKLPQTADTAKPAHAPTTAINEKPQKSQKKKATTKENEHKGSESKSAPATGENVNHDHSIDSFACAKYPPAQANHRDRHGKTSKE